MRSGRRRSAAALWAAPLLLAAAAVAPAAAGDEPITLADDPFEITDPVAAPPGEAEAAAVGSYTRARRGRVRGTAGLESELEIGVAPRLSLRLGQIGAYGNLEVRRRLGFAVQGTGADVGAGGDASSDSVERAYRGGATRLGALYQVAEERGAVPTIGVLGRGRVIYGPGRPTRRTSSPCSARPSRPPAAGCRPASTGTSAGWRASTRCRASGRTATFSTLPWARRSR